MIGVRLQVLCLGTPAEEEGGGKRQLIKKEAFKNVDFAMMVHPAPMNVAEPSILGVEHVSRSISFISKMIKVVFSVNSFYNRTPEQYTECCLYL